VGTTASAGCPNRRKKGKFFPRHLEGERRFGFLGRRVSVLRKAVEYTKIAVWMGRNNSFVRKCSWNSGGKGGCGLVRGELGMLVTCGRRWKISGRNSDKRIG